MSLTFKTLKKEFKSPWSLFSFFLSYGQYTGLSTLHLLPCPEFGKLCTSLPQVVLRSKHYIFPIILSGLVSQSCPTLCDPMDGSLAGSSVHGIFQARILEWVAIFFPRGSCWPRDQTQVSCIRGRFFTTEPLGKPIDLYIFLQFYCSHAKLQMHYLFWCLSNFLLSIKLCLQLIRGKVYELCPNLVWFF